MLAITAFSTCSSQGQGCGFCTKQASSGSTAQSHLVQSQAVASKRLIKRKVMQWELNRIGRKCVQCNKASRQKRYILGSHAQATAWQGQSALAPKMMS